MCIRDRCFPGETNFSVICEDGSFFSFNAKYAREPEMLNIEMKDFLENGHLAGEGAADVHPLPDDDFG